MARAAKKLSDALVRKLEAPPKSNMLHYDNELRGFACRVTAAGGKAFVLVYRFDGTERRDKIGGWPEWTAEAARTEAKRRKRDVDLGIDPRPAKPDGDGLFKSRAEAFLDHGRKKRGQPLRPATRREYRRALMTYAASLHNRPLAEIRRGEIATVVQGVAEDRGEVSAMRTRAALSRLYTWAIANGHAEANPVTGTEGYATPKRSRVLNDAELRAIWSATAEPSDFHLIVRLCLWTGARRAEPGGMGDRELTDHVWTIPGERTKNGRPLVLPLPRQALEALASWPRRLVPEGDQTVVRDRLFGTGRNGFQGWSKAKAGLDARLAQANAERRLGRPLCAGERPLKADALPDWGLHDLRRTVETRMAELRIAKDYVNRTLNHAAGPITEAYDLYSYLLEKRDALQTWADELDRITGAGGEPGNVVSLRQKRREAAPS